MEKKNKRGTGVIRFLNGKGFYIVICICFIAVGVAAWSGVESFRNKAKRDGTTSLPPVVSSQNTDVAKAPSETDDSSAKTEQGTESKPSKPQKSDNTSSEKSEPKNAEEAASPAATYFISPVLGNIIKGYSDSELQYSMIYRDMRLHKGVDIAADVGTPVTAAGDGTVIAVYKDAFEGSVVEIDHGNKIIVRYCGLNSAPCVKEGDRVDSSTQIGTIDNIPGESVEEHHLHVEFIKDGKFVSPEDYIQ